MMKLTLVAEGMIPAEAALGWLRNGFPIVFEGLLSVILNERAMIEDTVSAVEGLRLYQVGCVVNIFYARMRSIGVAQYRGTLPLREVSISVVLSHGTIFSLTLPVAKFISSSPVWFSSA